MGFTWISDFCVTHDKIFAFNIKYLFFVGLWPDENLPKALKFYYKIYETTLHIFSFIFLIISGIGTYQHRNEIDVFLTNIDKSLLGYNFVSKVIIFVIKRKHLRELVSEIEFTGDTVAEDRKILMCYHVIFITALSSTTAVAFSSLGLLNGEMTIEAWMPFDPMKNKMNLILSAQILAVLFVVPCLYRSFAMQGIVCSIVMYICDQLVELQNRLKALNYSSENEKVMRKEFKDIVRKHIRLIYYTKKMNLIFKEFFLIQNLAITMELCLNAMMITVIGLEKKMLLATFLAFLVAALLNAYIYCYLGNEMVLQSEGIALAAYEANWTQWPLDLQRDLLTVITMAQKPLHLSAGGIAIMSIQTYGQALYNGYSIFAVLNDMVD